MARPRTVALALTALTAAFVAGGAMIAVVWPGGQGPAFFVVWTLLQVPTLTTGLVIAVRRPDNAVGPLLTFMALVFAFVGFDDVYGWVATSNPGWLPVSSVVAALSQGLWMVLYLPAAFLMLTFPTGRLLGPRWRRVATGLIVVPVVFIAIGAVAPGPYMEQYQDVPHPWGEGPPWLHALGGSLLPVFLGLLIASGASMVVRYRRAADPVVRAQVRWFALSALILPMTLLLCWAGYLFLGTADLVVVGFAALLIALPGSILIALLRHDLYDVDRALSAAVTTGVVAAGLLSVFTAASAVTGAVLGRESAPAAAAVTAVSFVVLMPVYRRVRRWVDGHLYPLRQSVLGAITDLRSRIDAGKASPEDLEDTLRDALRAPELRLGYTPPGGGVVVDRTGTAIGGTVAVTLAGKRVGVLEPGRTVASRELLREAAAASAPLVELGRLRLELSRALTEVADSRGRLQRHGYEERRKLQRDLHDGAQQRLVSLGMSLRLAQRHLADGGVDMDDLIEQAVVQLGTAVAELRTLAHGLRPPALDDGLAAAVRSLTASMPLVVELDVAPDTVPDDVATTAYYVVSEALANTVRHADADRVHVSVGRTDERLRVRVTDDGVGGARPDGSGLAGLADRVAAAGGSLAVDSPSGRGTRIEAVLPCGS